MVVRSPNPHATDFRTYLQELDPVLGQNYVHLAAGGVKKVDDLMDLLRLPRNERDALLEEPEGCNIGAPLRFRMVRTALERLRVKCLDHTSRESLFALIEAQS